MSEELERVHTINLGKVLLSQPQHRTVRALNMIREFARRHMKTQDVKIDEDLARQVWSRGARSPPRRIRVRMNRTDMGHILVSRYDGPVEPEPAAEAPAVEDAAAKTAALEGSAALGPAKEAPSLPEPGTDAASDSDSASDVKAPDTAEAPDDKEAPPSDPAAAATAEKVDAAEQDKDDGLQAKAADPASDNDNDTSKLDDAIDAGVKAKPGDSSDGAGSAPPAQSDTDSDAEKTGENPDASDTGSEQSASDESQQPPAGKEDPDAAK